MTKAWKGMALFFALTAERESPSEGRRRLLMTLFELTTGAIAIFACGVFVGVMGCAVCLRMIVNKCNIIVGPEANELSKTIRKLQVYANPGRMTLKRRERNAGTAIKLKAVK